MHCASRSVQRWAAPERTRTVHWKQSPTSDRFMNKNNDFKVLEENQETLLALIIKLEREVKDLRILVREILHAMKKAENGR